MCVLQRKRATTIILQTAHSYPTDQDSRSDIKARHLDGSLVKPVSLFLLSQFRCRCGNQAKLPLN